jgi:hypothetical protein
VKLNTSSMLVLLLATFHQLLGKIYMDILRRSSIVVLLTILVLSLVILIFALMFGSNVRVQSSITDYSTVTNFNTK